MLPIIPSLLFLFFMALSRQYPPMRLNRMTREAYYYDGKTLYREAWDTLLVRITIFYYVTTTYSLQFGFRRPGKEPLWLPVGGGVLEEAHRDWAFYCGYMEQGLAMDVVEVPYHNYSKARKSKDSLFLKIIMLIMAPLNIIVYVGRWLATISWLSLRGGPIKYPQEIIDVCENNPALKAVKDKDRRVKSMAK